MFAPSPASGRHIEPEPDDPTPDPGLAEFLNRLSDEARSHRAVTHEWLDVFLSGDVDDVRRALRDIGHTHVGFVAWIPAMLQTVSSRCEDGRDRESLEHAQSIEYGDRGKPARRRLLRRFCADVGLTEWDLQHLPIAAAHWRSSVQRRLAVESAEFGVGVLGPGLADIASAIYSRVIIGCSRFPEFEQLDLTFFRSHVPDGTDPHQRQLTALTRRMSTSTRARAELRRGMLFGLDARVAVWDSLTGR
ncbi:MAG: hypothetical protein KDB80_00885 [Planctomycetes bacterium]|nr:hypothetical protein [Planctomycetota bacterium]